MMLSRAASNSQRVIFFTCKHKSHVVGLHVTNGNSCAECFSTSCNGSPALQTNISASYNLATKSVPHMLGFCCRTPHLVPNRMVKFSQKNREPLMAEIRQCVHQTVSSPWTQRETTLVLQF